ncbi:hypothetical protein HK405_015777, partial [Cladochytrium tenue]
MLSNSLGPNPTDEEANPDKYWNAMHGANSTNIHTHGLHVDPAVDNVGIVVKPGGTWQYNLTIPMDHAPGLHWYHSHKHGASALQVMGGLVGAIYVDPPENTTEKAFLLLKTLQRVLLVAHHFSINSINNSTDPFRVRTFADLSSISNLPINPQFQNSSYQDVYFVNGQFQPKLRFSTNQEIILDILNAVGDHVLELDIREQVQGASITEKCNMTQIASDGVYFNSTRPRSFVALLPSSRTSVVVSCSVPGTYYLTNVPDTALRPDITANETRFQQSLVTLVVTTNSSYTAPTTSVAATLDLASIQRPVYLTDMTTSAATAALNGSWELGVEQPSPGENLPWMANGKTWLGLGANCTLFSTGRADDGATPADANALCDYRPFPGQLGADSALSRHVAPASGAVVRATVNGRGQSAHSVHVH